MNNSGTEAKHLEPRAKIGDVVIADLGEGRSFRTKVDFVAHLDSGLDYTLENPLSSKSVIGGFKQEHILKNLTTNTVYE